MINMTSGLKSYTFDQEWQQSFFGNPTAPWTPDQLATIIRSLPPIFEPGAKYDYSNTNFVLLGLLAEKVTGQPVARPAAGAHHRAP